MKLHFKKDWVRKFDPQETFMEYGAGASLDKDSILAATGHKDTDANVVTLPLDLMAKYGWIKATAEQIRDHSEELTIGFLGPFGGQIPASVFCRKTLHENSFKSMNRAALAAWLIQVLQKAKQQPRKKKFSEDFIGKEFLQQVGRLSLHKNGPLLAQSLLLRVGIILVIERHLPQTYLDGCAILDQYGQPVIGMTLRHDRVDNFWFTLLHEIAHVWLHLASSETFVDNFDPSSTGYEQEKCELQANKYARDALIPRAVWKRSDAFTLQTPESVYGLASELEIHPAIIAGRIQYEFKNYTILREIVDEGSIRELFPKVNWGSS